MQTKFSAFLLLILAVGVFSVEAKTDQTVAVKINGQKTAAASKLTIKFDSLIEDSRCAKGVQCVWAGNARIRIVVSKGGKSETFDLNTNLNPRAVSFAGYEIKFTALTPYPGNNVRVDRNGFTATFSISKATKSSAANK